MKLLSVCICLLCCVTANAQTNGPAAIDSLVKKLGDSRDPAAKVKILLRLSNYYQTADPKLADKYENLGLSIAKQYKQDSAACLFYGYIAESYIAAGDFKNGIAQCETEIELAEKDDYKGQECLANSDIGLAYQMQGEYPRAQEYFFKALTLAEEIKNNYLSGICYVNICANFFNQNNYDKTIFYANKALAVCKGLTTNYAALTAKADELIGSSYLNNNKFEDAQRYYLAALKLYQDGHDDNGQASMYTLLTSTYPHDHEKQLEYGLKAQVIWDKLGPSNLYAIDNLGLLGSTYGEMAREEKRDAAKRNSLFDKAENHLSRAIAMAKQGNSKQNIIYFTDSLAVIQAERGKYKEAYANLVTHNQFYDSVYSQENKNKIAALEGQHDIALKDQEIRINKLEIANQAKQKWFLFGGLLTLIIIAGLIYFQSIQRKKTNTTLLLLNNELDEANKVKTKFFSILNHDLRSPIASFVNFLHLQQEASDLMDDTARDAYARKVIGSAENLLNTMEDMLLWSKGQMENFKPTNRTIPVQTLFEYIKETVDPPGNIELRFEQGPEMALHVDEHYLKTIMLNLTNNSIKALGTSPGSFISWKAWEEGSQKYLSITDNGPGATKEALKPLYDHSAPIGIKNGLGLHIVRDLAKAINCQLSVNSKPGHGIELKLTFS
ncbi:MAG: ATP-binding protein [Puia sp.]|nr:ATP-binding protein [Puia sp.]